MPNRIIKSTFRAGSVQLTDCLSSLLALELLRPGPELYLVSPWISNVPLLANRFGQFQAITGESTVRELRLLDILRLLSERGVKVRIICRADETTTADFLRLLPPAIEYCNTRTLHEKGLISQHFYLRGSMNFTFSGINLNDESVELTTEPTEVALAWADIRNRWESLLHDSD